MSTIKKVLHFHLTKIIIGFIVCMGAVSLGQVAIEKSLSITSIPPDFKKFIIGLTTALLALLSYVYLFKFYEKRVLTELNTQRIVKSLVYGAGLGMLLQSLTVLVIYLNGGYTIVNINPILYILPPLTMAFTSAIVEEILFRGILFRVIEEKLGSYLSLLISALLFGFIHISNPNSSFLTPVGLAIQAGLLLGAAYIYAKNLWFPIAIHFAWNFTQSAIFGANVSGNTIPKTLITSKIEGAEWFTGGEFGPEGSIQATIFCLVATIALLFLSHKKGNIVKPYWKL
jgi:hypothetical protein